MGWTNTSAVAPFTVTDSNGNVIAVIDANGIKVSDPTDNSYVQLQPDTFAGIVLQPQAPPAGDYGTYTSGYVTAYTGSDAPDYRPEMDLVSPAVSLGGTPTAEVHLIGGGQTTSGSTLELRADTIDVTPWNNGGDVTWDGHSVARTPLACFYNTSGNVASCPAVSGAETAMTAWTNSSTTVNLEAGRLYRFKLSTGVYHGDTSAACSQIRIRQTVNSTSSTPLGFFRAILSVEGSNVPGPFHYESYVKNTGTFDSEITPGITIARTAGNAVSHTLYGDTSGTQCHLVVEDAGLISDNADLAAVAYAIT